MSSILGWKKLLCHKASSCLIPTCLTNNWRTAKFTEHGVDCTTVIPFIRRRKKLVFEWKFCESCINRAVSVKGLAVLVDCTIIGYTRFVRTVAFFAFSLDSHLRLNFTTVKFKLLYSIVERNSITLLKPTGFIACGGIFCKLPLFFNQSVCYIWLWCWYL